MSLYGSVKYHKTQRVLIAAKYAGKQVEVKETMAPESLLVPKGSVPVFHENDVTLFETNSILEFLWNKESDAEVSQWCNFADAALLPAVGTLVLPTLGHLASIKPDQDKAKAVLAEELTFIDRHLSTRTFLAGERISRADIALFTVIRPLFETIYDDAARKPLINLSRWFLTIGNQDNVRTVQGDIILCVTPAVFDAKKYAELHPKKEKEPKVEKKEAKKEPKAEKKAKKVDDDDDDEEEPLVPVEKESDPYKLLPSGTFNMDEWKKVYSNNDIATIALDYFWGKLDTENYSIWTCEYLFPEELNLIFMTCNLVSGMFQRLEKLRKYAFGSMVVLGKDKDNTIKGLWVWRGQDLAFPMSPDCSIDYESYKWEKLDPKAESTKASVKNYFLHEGDFGEKAFNQGKIFK